MNRPRSVSTPALAALAFLGFGLVYGLPLSALDAAVTLGWHA
ncbi:hypothetical protein YT1_2291 [Rhodococcus ruber]|nr:hypothetical protein YT1_2291 [Rhodococcus ruber]